MTGKLQKFALVEGSVVHFKAEASELPCRAALVVKVTRNRGKRIEVGRDDEDEPIYKQEWMRPDSGSVVLEVFYSPEDLRHVIGEVASHSQQKLAVHGMANGEWHTFEECDSE